MNTLPHPRPADTPPADTPPAVTPTLGARARARAREESGAALVEFALVAVVLCIFLFGITQFGLALNSANDATHLANEVARYAAVNQNPGTGGQTLGAWAKAQGDTNFLASGGSVCITFPNGTSNIGDPVQVVVSMTMSWNPLSNFVPGISGTSTISGKAVMRLEASPTVYASGCS